MELSTALGFLRQHSQGVLTTLKRDGRPQLSNILYGVFPDGSVAISATERTAKTANLRRDPRASLWVDRGDFWGFVVVEADAAVSPPVTSPDEATVDELVELYRTIRGEEHPDWSEYRQAMVTERRVLITLQPTRAYGRLPDA